MCLCVGVCTGASTLLLCVLQQQIVYHSSLPYIIKRLALSLFLLLASRATLAITANTLHSNTTDPFRAVLSPSRSTLFLPLPLFLSSAASLSASCCLLHSLQTIDQLGRSNLWAKTQSVRQLSCICQQQQQQLQQQQLQQQQH